MINEVSSAISFEKRNFVKTYRYKQKINIIKEIYSTKK